MPRNTVTFSDLLDNKIFLKVQDWNFMKEIFRYTDHHRFPFFTFCEVNEATKMKNIGNKKSMCISKETLFFLSTVKEFIVIHVCLMCFSIFQFRSCHLIFSSRCPEHWPGLLQKQRQHHCWVCRSFRGNQLHPEGRVNDGGFLLWDPNSKVPGHGGGPAALHRLQSERHVCQLRRKEPAFIPHQSQDR